jgi:hypothetical protein
MVHQRVSSVPSAVVIGSPGNIVTMVEPDVSFSHPWDEAAVLAKGRESPVRPC